MYDMTLAWILAFIIIAAFIYGIYRFILMSREEQLSKVSEWLLWAVTLAEKEYGGGTGKIKLREVYAKFVEAWPQVSRWLTFNDFSRLVDKVLVQMRSILTTNSAAYNYVAGGKVCS